MKFSLLDHKDVHLAQGEKIIPSDALGKLIDAETLLTTAKKDVERLLKETRKKCASLRAQAKEKGFQEGLETFNAHLLHFDARIKTLEVELQRQILPLAITAAKKIVAGELTTRPDVIVDIVLTVIAPVVQNQRFTIFVNRADKEILEKEKEKIKEILEHLQVLRIVERDDIEPGGCIIETESGIINATLENQWRALEAAFKKFTQQT